VTVGASVTRPRPLALHHFREVLELVPGHLDAASEIRVIESRALEIRVIESRALARGTKPPKTR
jgi:hypothetical protein